jgi:hypothetical protein
VDEITTSILKEHLPYELEMLERSFEFLHAERFAEIRKPGFFKNAAIEVFWLHARNLIEFLVYPKNGSHQGTVSAKDFTSSEYSIDAKMREIDQRINAGVTHLLYERKRLPVDKLGGFDMQRVKDAIERGMRGFETTLLPEFRAIWVPRPAPDTIYVLDQVSSTSSDTTSMTIITYGIDAGRGGAGS